MPATPTPAAPELASGFDTGISDADNITSVNTPSIAGVAAPGATVTLYDSDGTTVLGQATASATSGAYTITIAGRTDANGFPINLDDGVHRLTVTQQLPGEDPSNPSPALALTIDTQAPDPPTAPKLTAASDTGASALDGVTSATVLTLTGQSEPGAVVTLLNGDNVVGQGTVDASGAYAITTGTLADGTYAFKAYATDAAGNQSKVDKDTATSTVTIDTAPPPAPPAPMLAASSDTGPSHADGLTSDTAPTVTGTAEAGDTVTLKDADGSVLGKATARADGSYAITSGTLLAGPHALSVTATDAAGNTSPGSAPLDIVVDDSTPTASVTAALATASAPSITFTIQFNGPIADRRGISPDDFVLVTTGTAYGDIGSVTGSGQTGTVTVTGLGGEGTIALALAADSQITNLAGTKVVLASTQSHDVSDVQGGDVEPVSAGPTGVVGTGENPSASTNGRFVAFDSNFNNAAGQYNVYVKDVQTDGLTKVSVASDGSASDGNSFAPSLSASGGVVAFDSQADNIAAGPEGPVSGTNVYAVDLVPAPAGSSDAVQIGASFLVSAGNGTYGSDPAVAPVVSGDGSTIAFSSSQPLVAGVSGGYDNVYVYNLTTGALTLITPSTGQNEWDYIFVSDPYLGSVKAYRPVAYQPGGVGGDGDSTVTSISASGTEIAFQSYATDLGAPDLNVGDAEFDGGPPLRSYVYNTATGKLTVLDGAGAFGNADAPHLYRTIDPKLSADGSTVTYTVVYANASATVFEENLATGAITQLTPSPVNALGGDVDGQATLSKDGTYFAYVRDENQTTVTDGQTTTTTTPELYTSATATPVTNEAQYTGDTGYPGGQVSLTSSANAVVFTAALGDGTQVLEDTLGVTAGIDPVGTEDEIDAAQLSAAQAAGSFTVTGHTDAPAGAIVQVQVGPQPGAPSAIVTGRTAGDGTWSASIPVGDLGADGTYLVAATVLGASAASARVVRSFTLDTQAPATPAAPALDTASNTDLAHDGMMSDTDTPTLTGTAEPGSTVTLIDEGGLSPGVVLGTGIADSHGLYAITSAALTQGGHDLAVTATDEAGNVSAPSTTLALGIDSITPDPSGAPEMVAQSSIDPITGNTKVTNASVADPDGDGILTQSSTPVLSGRAVPGALVTLHDSDGIAVLGTATASATGAWTIASNALTDGLHALTVTQTTPAGAVSGASEPLDLTVDTLPPLSPVITSVGGPLTVNAEHTSQVDVNGTAEPGSTVALHVDNDPNPSGSATADAEGDYTINGLVGPGKHGLTVIATDAAGNASQPSAVTDVLVDDPKTPSLTTPAGVPIAGTEQDGYISGATVFADLNGDGTLDPGDPAVVTGLGGNFALYGAAGATLIATGGNDIDTGLTLPGALESPAPAAVTDVISPLTTLLAAVMRQTGLGLDAANAATDTALGLPAYALTTLDVIGSFAPSAQGQIQGEVDAEVWMAKLADTASVLSDVIASASGGAVAPSAAFAAVFSAMAQQVAEAGTLDLSTQAGAASILAAAATAAQPGLIVPTALAAGAAQIVAAGNAAVDALGATAEHEVSSPELLPGVAAIEYVEQGSAAKALANATAGTLPTVIAAYTGAAFQTKEAAAAATTTLSAPVLAPNSDTGPSDTDGITSDDTPTFTGTALPGAEVVLETVGSYAGSNQIVGLGTADATGHYSITTIPLSSTSEPGNPIYTNDNGYFAVVALLPTAQSLQIGAPAAYTPLTITPFTEVFVGANQFVPGNAPTIDGVASVPTADGDGDSAALQIFAHVGYDNLQSAYPSTVAVYADGGTTAVARSAALSEALGQELVLTTAPLSPGMHTLTLVETTASGTTWTSAPFTAAVSLPDTLAGAASAGGALTGGEVFIQTEAQHVLGGAARGFNPSVPVVQANVTFPGANVTDVQTTSDAMGMFSLPMPDATDTIGIQGGWNALLDTPVEGGAAALDPERTTAALFAPAGVGDMTPFSSVVDAALGQFTGQFSGNAVPESAAVAADESAMLSSLGLSPGQDLLSGDPLAAAEAGDPTAFLLNVKLLDTVTLLLPLTEGSFAWEWLGDYLYSDYRNGGVLNLDDPSSVLAMLQAEEPRTAQVPAGLLPALATIIAASNAQVDAYAAAASGPADLISYTLAAQYVTQTIEAGDVAAAIDQVSRAVDAQYGQSSPPSPGPAIMAPVVAADTGAALDAAITAQRAAMVQVTGFAPLGGAVTEDGTVTFRITFSQPVGGVGAGHFTLSAPTLADASVLGVAPVAGSGGSAYDITVQTGAGAGQITLSYDGIGLTAPAGAPLDTGSYGQPIFLGDEAGAWPDAIALGDLTGNGRLDIVTARPSDGGTRPAGDARTTYNVQVFLNEADGRFVPASIGVTLPNVVTDVVLGDVTGDGKLDIIAASASFDDGDPGFDNDQGDGFSEGDTTPEDSHFDGTLTILPGNGDGTFGAPIRVSGGFDAIRLATGDFNGDGNLDIVTNGGTAGTLTLLLGNGDNTFQTSSLTLPAAVQPTNVAVAHLTGDSHADIIASDETDGTLEILRGNGDGTFQPGITVPIGSGRVPTSDAQTYGLALTTADESDNIAAGDLTGNGVTDIVTVNPADRTVVLLRGDGTGGFTPQTVFTFPTGPFPATEGNDGFGAALMFGDSFLQAFTPSSVSIADLNGDAIPDLLIGNGGESTLTLLGNGDGSFRVGPETSDGPASESDQDTLGTFNLRAGTAVAADLNGDGRTDIVTSGYDPETEQYDTAVLPAAAPDALPATSSVSVLRPPLASPFLDDATTPGALQVSGNSYTLDLGPLAQGSALPAIGFILGNRTSEFATDALSGVFSVPAAQGFTVSGTTLPSPLSTGQTYDGLTVAVDTTSVGAHTQTIIFLPYDQTDPGTAYGTDSATFDNVVASSQPVTTGAALPPITLTITDDIMPCFAKGTRIATPAGPRAVETLRPGDRVLTACGGSRPIVWVGDRRVDCRRHADPPAVLPVRIAAGAFAPGIPARDLLLSPDHGVYASGVLIPVKHLVNGTSITQRRRARIHYFHVELDRHDIILAEDLPVESFLDTGNRALFDTPAIRHLHPDFGRRVWEAEGCAPLVVTGRLVEDLRDSLSARAQPGATCLLNAA